MSRVNIKQLKGATSGSVLFLEGTELRVAEDNANFFWDDTNNRLGLGTNAPASRLHISNTGGEVLRVTGASGTMMNFNGSTSIWTIGVGASAASNDSVVIGLSATGGTNREVAIGTSAVASSQGVSIGYLTSTNDRGVAIGYGASNTGTAVSIGENSTAVGGVSIKGTGTNPAHLAIIGTASGAGMGIALLGLSEGDDSAAIGFRTRATAAGAWAIGRSVDNSTYMTNATANSFGIGWSEATPTVLFAKTADQYINGTGNLGIGTTTPSVKLHVRGSGTGSGTYGLRIDNNTSTTALQVRDDGIVSVNTTSPSGTYTFEVNNGRIGVVKNGTTFTTLGTADYALVSEIKATAGGTSYRSNVNSWINGTLTAAITTQQAAQSNFTSWVGDTTYPTVTGQLTAQTNQVRYAASSGSIRSGAGVSSTMVNSTAGFTVGYHHAFYAAITGTNNGTTQAWSGYYVPVLTAVTGVPAANLRWGLRIEDPGVNWLAGKLGIGSGRLNPNMTLDVDGDFGTSQTNLSFGANQNNVSTASRSWVTFEDTSGLGYNITGFADGYTGKRLVIANRGATALVLKNEDTNSTAGNRMNLYNPLSGNSEDYTLQPNDTVELIYDATSAVWRKIN